MTELTFIGSESDGKRINNLIRMTNAFLKSDGYRVVEITPSKMRVKPIYADYVEIYYDRDTEPEIQTECYGALTQDEIKHNVISMYEDACSAVDRLKHLAQDLENYRDDFSWRDK